MMNNSWAIRKELMNQTNRGTRLDECNNQMLNNHQSANGHFRTPQAMLQRPQNQFMGVNNFTQERCHKNNIDAAATLPMSTFSSSRNNTPIIPSYRASLARYDRTLPLDLPQSHASSCNTPIIPSYRANLARNSSSSYLGSQGIAAGFRNPSKPNLHNQKNFRYHPYEEGYNHKNNSLVFNDVDPLSRVAMNSFQKLKNYVAPIATPRSISPSGNTGLDSIGESIISSYYRANLARNSKSSCLGSQDFPIGFPNPSKPNLPNQQNFQYHPYGEGSNHKNNSLVFNNFDPLSRVDMNSFQKLKNYVAPIGTLPSSCPSGNASLDLTREKSSEHSMFDTRNTDAWKRLMSCPNGCYEEIQNQKKELLLFKDDKNTFPTSLVIETADDANENDDDPQLDLKLCL